MQALKLSDRYTALSLLTPLLATLGRIVPIYEAGVASRRTRDQHYHRGGMPCSDPDPPGRVD